MLEGQNILKLQKLGEKWAKVPYKCSLAFNLAWHPTIIKVINEIPRQNCLEVQLGTKPWEKHIWTMQLSKLSNCPNCRQKYPFNGMGAPYVLTCMTMFNEYVFSLARRWFFWIHVTPPMNKWRTICLWKHEKKFHWVHLENVNMKFIVCHLQAIIPKFMWGFIAHFLDLLFHVRGQEAWAEKSITKTNIKARLLISFVQPSVYIEPNT